MKYPYLYIIIILILISFSSCEKVIEFDGEVKEPKLVVNALFNTDDTFVVWLSNSLAVIDAGELKDIQTATVKIFDENNQFLGKVNHTNNGLYKAVDLNLMENKRYKIEVSNDGFRTVTAEDKIPTSVDIISFETNDVQNVNGYQEKEISFKFIDPSEANYYMVELRSVNRYGFQEPKDSSIRKEYIGTNDPNITNRTGNGKYYNRTLIFSDKNFNGQNYSFKFTTDDYMFSDSNYVSIEVLFTSLSSATYNYFTSLERYQNTDGNPFATPVQVYNNIENGFGIFGGASTEVVKVK